MSEPKAEDTVRQLESVETREQLRAILKPIRDAHDEHRDPFDYPDCPFCNGAIT